MAQKAYFIVVGLFFVLMNAFLWRAEFSDQDLSVPVPLDSVVRRLLETADDSTMEIRHRGRKVGYCRWAVNLLSENSGASPSSVPEGMVTGVTGYAIDLDGNVSLRETGSLRFNCSFNISTNQQWQHFHLRIGKPPLELEIQSVAAEESLKMTLTRGGQLREYSYRFQQLRDPLTLLRDLAGPFWSGAMETLGFASPPIRQAPHQWGVRWSAHTDRHPIGHSMVPVYRVEAPLFDKFKITVLIQKSGEILRVQLPDEWTLVNDKLLSM